MKVGVMFQGLPRRRPSVVARWIEDLGYDSMWAGDHVLSYVDGLSATLTFGVATERLLVGTAVLLAPLRNPALLARSLATIGEELPGRFVLGLGAGGDIPDEFEVVGADLAGRGRRVAETIDVVRRALDQGDLFGRRFLDQPPAGAPPVWLGGRTDVAARRAGRLANGFLPYLVMPDQYARLRDVARAEFGTRHVESFSWAVDILISVGQTEKDAVGDALAYSAYGMDEERIRRYSVIGTPEHCLEQLQGFAMVGVEHLVLHVSAPVERKHQQIETLAELIPALHAA